MERNQPLALPCCHFPAATEGAPVAGHPASNLAVAHYLGYRKKSGQTVSIYRQSGRYALRQNGRQKNQILQSNPFSGKR